MVSLWRYVPQNSVPKYRVIMALFIAGIRFVVRSVFDHASALALWDLT